MRRICGWHYQLLGRARLPGFDVRIDMRGYLNMEEKAGEETHGILYSMDEEGLSMLDEFEGYPEIFGRMEVTVFDDHNVKYKAHVFIQPKEKNVGKELREEFFRRVLAAAYENHLPEKWIEKLENLGKGREKV